MSAGLGNVQLNLGLNTTPATQALQQYYQKLNEGAQKAARSQKPVETALNKLTEGAKKLGKIKSIKQIENDTNSNVWPTDGSVKNPNVTSLLQRLVRIGDW